MTSPAHLAHPAFSSHACALFAVTLFACASSAGSVATKPGGKPAWRRSCVDYAGAPVSIHYEDASGGAAVLYRSRGNVAALRQRTHEVAKFHNSARGKAGALHDLFAIPHRAHVEDIEGGARLVLVPKSIRPEVLMKLRVQVQQETFTLQKRGCGTGQEAL